MSRIRLERNPALDPLELTSPEMVERVARALEETAARVRAHPPLVHELVMQDDTEFLEPHPYERPPTRAAVAVTRPRVRHFHLEWPD